MAHAYMSEYYSEGFRVNSSTWSPTPSGTLTLSAVTVTLRDAAGEIVEGCDHVPATAFTSGASAAPYAQYFLEPGPDGLNLDEPTPATGQQSYTLTFEATDTGGNTYSSVIAVVLKPDGT